MFRISFVAVSPIALPNHPSKDVDLIYFVADCASNLELPSILEVLPKPATVTVFSYSDEIVSVDDHPKNSLWVEEGARTGSSRDEPDAYHRYSDATLPRFGRIACAIEITKKENLLVAHLRR